MFTIAGFGEDIDLASTEANLAALADDHLFVSGDDLRVPVLREIIMVAGGLATGGTGLMRLESPSLRKINRLVISPLNGLADADVEPSDPMALMNMTQNPRRVDVDENLSVRANSNTSAAAFQWCIVFFADGVAQKAGGEVVTVRSTGSTTVSARNWSTVSLSFADDLPTGRYQVVGMRAQGATAIAARLVFKPGTWRPGCIAVDSDVSVTPEIFRNGSLGVWGEFISTQPPDVEYLCDAADTAQTVDLDLVAV